MTEQIEDSTPKKGYAAYMIQTFDHPMVERFQKPRTRKTLVALMWVWFITVNLVAFKFPGAMWAWGILFLAFFPLTSALNMSVRGVTEIPIKALDDRQAKLKSTAYLHAYWLGLCLAVLFGFVLAKFASEGPHMLPFFAGGIGMLIGLPAMILACRLPDETQQDS